MAMLKNTYLDAIPLFPKHRISLSAHMEIDPSQSHQIPFISSINKGLAYKCSTIKGFEGNDLVVFHGYTTWRTIQPPVSVDHDVVLPDHVFKSRFSNMGFKQPHGFKAGIVGYGSLTLVTKG